MVVKVWNRSLIIYKFKVSLPMQCMWSLKFSYAEAKLKQKIAGTD